MFDPENKRPDECCGSPSWNATTLKQTPQLGTETEGNMRQLNVRPTGQAVKAKLAGGACEEISQFSKVYQIFSEQTQKTEDLNWEQT